MRKSSLKAAFVAAMLFAFVACKPKEINQLAESASALSKVFAAETAHAAKGKQIVVIACNVPQGPLASVAGDFKSEFEKQGLSIIETKTVELGDPMNYRDYGLKLADLLEVMNKHPEAGAIVSLVGAPLVRGAELGEIPASHPPVFVIATAQIGLAPGVPTNPGALRQMLDAKVIQMAVADGAGIAGGKTDAEKIFNQHYQILRSNF